MMQKPRGFTLIELLVVIAIIGILAAILYPVIMKGREKAWQAKCMSNQRQISTAIISWMHDHDETFPTADKVWDNINLDKQVYRCLAAKKGLNSYVYSDHIAGKKSAVVYDPINEVLTADGVHLAVPDSVPETYDNILYTKDDLDLRHGGRALVSYADGHVALTNYLGAFSASLWLCADRGVTLTGNTVSAWADQSGNNRVALPAAPANQPRQVIDTNRSRPVLSFDGVDDALQVQGSITAGTAFIVMNYNGPQFAANHPTALGALPGQDSNAGLFRGDDASANLRSLSWDSGDGIFEGNIGINSIKTLSFDPPKEYKVVSGYCPTAKGPKTLQGLTIGSNPGENSFWRGGIAEIVIFDTVLSAERLHTMEESLKLKYNIQ